jgi:hypothetical protein
VQLQRIVVALAASSRLVVLRRIVVEGWIAPHIHH